MPDSDNAGGKQRHRGQFKPGQSGNPKGKPKGTRNRATTIAQDLLDGEAQALTRKAVELAKEGNPVALRLCIERLIPPRRDRSIAFELPKVQSAEDLPRAFAKIMDAVAKGELTPGEGQTVTALLEAWRKGFEMTELEARVRALEDKGEASHGR